MNSLPNVKREGFLLRLLRRLFSISDQLIRVVGLALCVAFSRQITCAAWELRNFCTEWRIGQGELPVFVRASCDTVDRRAELQVAFDKP